jgi:urease subunit gamma/beta
MRLLPIELDRLTIFTPAELARRRLAKGWRLTHPEALARICDEMHEAARGAGSYAEVGAGCCSTWRSTQSTRRGRKASTASSAPCAVAEVTIDGQPLPTLPIDDVPLSRRYLVL